MLKKTRRQFLEESMFATAAALAASSGSSLLAEVVPQSSSPNERLGVAVVGVNGRGGSHLGAFMERNDTEVRYIVDPDERVGRGRAESVAAKTGKTPKWVADMREAFDDKTVDIVTVATPNHWHSLAGIWAMQAGKDVYVEKPVSHNVSEGRRMVQVARKYGRICQAGTQSRSNPGMREAIEYMASGKMGKITLGRGLCYKRRETIGPKGVYEVPAHVNYDLWLGPAPFEPLTRPKFHYDWHMQFAYGNGDLGNQGIHQMDIARWGLGAGAISNSVFCYGGRLGYEDAGDAANTQVVVHDYGDRSLVFEVRGLKTGPYRGAGVGVIFEGTEGYMIVPSYSGGTVFDKEGKTVASFNGGGDSHHYENFLKAVRSRKHEDLNADILEGHLSSALCHLGNISYRLGTSVPASQVKERLQSLKTTDNALDTFERTAAHLAENQVDLAKVNLILGPQLPLDPAAEKFIDNPQADQLLTREYRPPYVVPTEDKI